MSFVLGPLVFNLSQYRDPAAVIGPNGPPSWGWIEHSGRSFLIKCVDDCNLACRREGPQCAPPLFEGTRASLVSGRWVPSFSLLPLLVCSRRYRSLSLFYDYYIVLGT